MQKIIICSALLFSTISLGMEIESGSTANPVGQVFKNKDLTTEIVNALAQNAQIDQCNAYKSIISFAKTCKFANQLVKHILQNADKNPKFHYLRANCLLPKDPFMQIAGKIGDAYMFSQIKKHFDKFGINQLQKALGAQKTSVTKTSCLPPYKDHNELESFDQTLQRYPKRARDYINDLVKEKAAEQ